MNWANSVSYVCWYPWSNCRSFFCVYGERCAQQYPTGARTHCWHRFHLTAAPISITRSPISPSKVERPHSQWSGDRQVGLLAVSAGFMLTPPRGVPGVLSNTPGRAIDPLQGLNLSIHECHELSMCRGLGHR